MTRGRLLLHRGRYEDALRCLTQAAGAALELTDPSLTAHLRLLRAEALVRTGQHEEAAGVITEAVDAGEGPPSMEMLAEIARVAGLALAARPGPESGAVAFERAACILGTVGNRSGRVDLLQTYAEELWPRAAAPGAAFERQPRADTLPPPPRRVTARLDAVTTLAPAAAPPAAIAADRAATILDAGGYPEVLAHETVALLRDTGAAPVGVLAASAAGQPAEIISWWGCSWSDAGRLAACPPRAIDLGAWHGRTFTISVRQPRDPGPLVALLAVEKLVKTARWQEKTRRDERERAALWPVDHDGETGDAIFRSEAMNEIVASARKVAGISLTVLLTGETGTGKEVLARVIHAASPRADRPFVPFNCTAVPREMIDSQLFGYRRGAFTGAVADFPGVIRAAQGGTLFLDEIGELGLDVQPKLLRFLESGEIQPLGDAKPAKVDVRVIASTNANLDTFVADGRFREDLYYRLKVLAFPLPPLRERREEIPPLAESFLQRAARDFKKDGLRLAEETMEYLVLYRWPGNVRQLANEMRRLAALAEPGALLMPEHLDQAICAGRRTIPASERELGSNEVVVRLDQPFAAALEHLERAMLQRALKASAGRLEDAARALGLSRKGLYLKRARLGL